MQLIWDINWEEFTLTAQDVTSYSACMSIGCTYQELGKPGIANSTRCICPFFGQRVIQIASEGAEEEGERPAGYRGSGEGLYATFGLSLMGGGTLPLSKGSHCILQWLLLRHRLGRIPQLANGVENFRWNLAQDGLE